MIKDADWQQRIGALPERSRRRRRRRRSGCLTRFLAFVLVVAALAGVVLVAAERAEQRRN